MKYKTKNVCTANDKINEDKKLKKKRRQKQKKNLSNKSKAGKDKKQETMKVSEVHKNSENIKVAEEKEEGYCTQNCKFGRKSKGMPMIQCDGCGSWFHCKCINFTDKKFKTFSIKGKCLYCPNCS